MEPINFLNVVKYFDGSQNQIKALEFLQNSVDPKVLTHFASIWRSKPSLTIEDKILSRVGELNLKLDEGVNLIGLEGCSLDFTSNKDLPDEYNDLFLVAEYGSNSFKILGKSPCTTEPGIHYTKFRLNTSGVARLEIDFKHSGIWQIGSHKSQFPALVQTGGKVRLRRDGNEDFSRLNDKIDEGFFGKV